MGNKTAGEIQGPRQCLKDGNEKLVTERLSGLFQARTEVKKTRTTCKEGTVMRFLVRVSFAVEAANAATKKNGLSVIRQILDSRNQRLPNSSSIVANVPVSLSSISPLRRTFRRSLSHGFWH
jgi:hypothetical protein